MNRPSLSVVLCAYNEQDNIAQCIDNVTFALKNLVDDYEIIVVDDGSQDKTFLIAQDKATQNARVSCVRNDHNRGYGYSYGRAIKLASKYYVGSFTSDNDMSWESLREMVQKIGQADIITSYVGNKDKHHPQWLRRILSRIFVAVMNTAFSMQLKYFNGHFISRREFLQALTIRSNGLTVLAECQVKLIRQGCSFMEIPIVHIPRSGGKSSALRLKSIVAVLKDLGLLYRDIYFKA